MRVLIVDDEQHVREAIGLLADWERHGITEIDQAADGEEAVRLIEEREPQIVMTDMRMPRINGTQLLTWLHTTKPDIKVLVISGYDDFEYVRHTIRSGGIDYILKPIDPDSLNEALSKAVQAWQLEEKKRQRITKQNIEMNQMAPFYMDRLFSNLLGGYGDKENIISQLTKRVLLPPAGRNAALPCFVMINSMKGFCPSFATNGSCSPSPSLIFATSCSKIKGLPFDTSINQERSFSSAGIRDSL